MPFFVYVGSSPRDFPGDGERPSFAVDVGAVVDMDVNPDPRWFDPESDGDPGSQPPPNVGSTSAEVQEG